MKKYKAPRTNFEPPSGKRTKQNEVEWLEWQAHKLVPRVLMPKNMFIKKAEEFIRDYEDVFGELKRKEHIAVSVADAFGVDTTLLSFHPKYQAGFVVLV